MTSLFRRSILSVCALVFLVAFSSCSENTVAPVIRTPILTGPGAIGFGDVALGTCKDTTIRYDNTTGKSVTLTSVTFAGAGFEWTGSALPAEVAAGASIDLKVRYCPASKDSAKATLVFKGTGGDSVAVKLGGNGIELKPIVTGPLAINFGATQVGVCKDTTIRYDNATSNAVMITNVVITGAGAASFMQTENLNSTAVAAGASVDLKLRYCPTAKDSSIASLTITGTGGVAVSILLSGKGVEQQVGSNGPTVGSTYTYDVFLTDSLGSKVPGSDGTELDEIVEAGISYEGKDNVFVVFENGSPSYYSIESNGDISVYLDAAQAGPFGSLIQGWKRLPYGSKKTNVKLFTKDTTISIPGVPVPVTASVTQTASYVGESSITVNGKTLKVLNVTFTTAVDLVAVIIPVGNITNVVQAGFIPEIGYQANFDSQLESSVQGFAGSGSRKKLKNYTIK